MADQHNNNIPAVGNQIANDIPDIKENLEFHKDVFERLVQNWSSTDATGIDFSTTPTFNNGSVEIAWPSNNMSSGSPKVMVGDSNTIAWFYQNTAPPGWKALSTGGDTVLAVSGGSGDYNVNGGNPDTTASWEIDGLTAANESSHTHSTTIPATGWSLGTHSTGIQGINVAVGEEIDAKAITSGGGSAHSHTVSSDSSYRPSASVGKLFQLDTA